MPIKIDHAKAVQFRQEAADGLREQRANAFIDSDYLDGEQWTEDEKRELAHRNQMPVVVNLIQPKISAVCGSEIRGRRDPKAIPRTQTHEDDAAPMTDALRYVADMNSLDQIKSLCAEDFYKVGWCGTHSEIDAEDENAVRITRIEWDRLFWDPVSRKHDFGDAKFVGFDTRMDVEDAKSDPRYEGKEDVIDATERTASESYDEEANSETDLVWYNRSTKSILVVEMYYQSGGVWYVTHFVRGGFLIEPRAVQLRDDRRKPRTVCPLNMMSCFILRKNHERCGLVRGMIHAQDEINHRRSKALYALSVRQAKYTGALDANVLRDELAMPDAMIKINEGENFDILPTGDMTQWQFQIYQQSMYEMDLVGPSIGLQGPVDEDTSGRAVLARQDAGSLALEPVFDRMASWERTVFQHSWFWIRRFWTEEKWLNVTDDQERKGYRFVPLNRKVTRGERMEELMEDGADLPAALTLVGMDKREAKQVAGMVEQAKQSEQGAVLMQQMMAEFQPFLEEELVLNNVAESQIDVIITQGPDVPTIQQEQYQKLAEVLGALSAIPDNQRARLIIEASQLRNKEELLKLLEEPPPDPKAEQEAAIAKELQLESIKAELRKIVSEAMENEANAQRTLADAEKKKAETAEIAAEVGAKTAEASYLQPADLPQGGEGLTL